MQLKETVDYINEKTNNFAPEIAIVLGSGLGDFADDFCDIALSYKDIPGFEASTVKGHKGQLVLRLLLVKKL